MANRRMFSLSIVDTDLFLEMPVTSRLLYYELGMRADDDGFVSNWKKIMRMTNLSEDDMKVLIAKKFIIPFESGVIVIRHWRLNNYLQKDRKTSTVYKTEMSSLQLHDNVYELCSGETSKNPLMLEESLEQIQKEKDTETPSVYKNTKNVYKNTKNVYTDKDSIDKSSIEKKESKKKEKPSYDETILNDGLDDTVNLALRDFIQMRQMIKKPLTNRALELVIGKLKKMSELPSTQKRILEQSIMNNWQGLYPLKEDSTEKAKEGEYPEEWGEYFA